MDDEFRLESQEVAEHHRLGTVLVELTEDDERIFGPGIWCDRGHFDLTIVEVIDLARLGQLENVHDGHEDLLGG